MAEITKISHSSIIRNCVKGHGVTGSRGKPHWVYAWYPPWPHLTVHHNLNYRTGLLRKKSRRKNAEPNPLSQQRYDKEDVILKLECYLLHVLSRFQVNILLKNLCCHPMLCLLRLTLRFVSQTWNKTRTVFGFCGKPIPWSYLPWHVYFTLQILFVKVKLVQIAMVIGLDWLR